MKSVKYSIRDLEKLTGIKAHTIRIWEKRYGIICPDRTSTNIRYYSDDDLRKLLNICILRNNGFKISRISEMSEDQIITSVSEVSEINKLADADINSLVIAALELQEDHFERLLNACLIKFGFEQTFCYVVFPMLIKIRIMWQIERISACQQRFITNLIRKKLLVSIDGIVSNVSVDKGSFLLFTPAGHDNEVGLLFANYIIRKHGYQVVYLGSDVPFEHLERFESPDKFNHLFIFLNRATNESEIESYIRQLRTVYINPEINIFLQGGFLPSDIKKLGELNFYNDFMTFGQKLI